MNPSGEFQLQLARSDAGSQTVVEAVPNGKSRESQNLMFVWAGEVGPSCQPSVDYANKKRDTIEVVPNEKSPESRKSVFRTGPTFWWTALTYKELQSSPYKEVLSVTVPDV